MKSEEGRSGKAVLYHNFWDLIEFGSSSGCASGCHPERMRNKRCCECSRMSALGSLYIGFSPTGKAALGR